VPATIVAVMIALPVLIAPFRALLGFRSDTYRSAIGWKRIPYLWFGSLWQMGGLAVMPFACWCWAATARRPLGRARCWRRWPS
jgi:BCD family chlorophyll transporter-like MFS transporter